MNLSTFLRGQREVQRQNRGLVLAVVLLAGTHLLAWWRYDAQAVAVILTPPTLTQPVRVARNQADAPYKMAWGLFVAQLLGNVTPGSGELVLPALEPLLDATLYQPVRLGINEQLRQLRQEQISVSFAPRDTQYEATTDTVFVTGRLTTAGPSGAPRQSERTYEMRWQLEHYHPRLVHLAAYNGPPRLAIQGPAPTSPETSP